MACAAMTENVVLDANILIKLFWKENDSDVVRRLYEHLMNQNVKVLASELLISETMDVCLSKGVNGQDLMRFFEN